MNQPTAGTDARFGQAPFAAELRITPQSVFAIMIATGCVLDLVHEFLPASASIGLISFLLMILGGSAWFLAGRRPNWGVFLAVIIPVGLVLFAYRVLEMPNALPLLAASIVLAAALSGFVAALIVAASETVLLLLLFYLPPLNLNLSDVVVAWIIIWVTTCGLYAIYLPMYQLQRWLAEYFKRAQDAVEEAQDRRAELEQVLADLAHVNRQLALANERTSAMRLVAEEAQKSKAAFVAKVSHEFRTPLNMIIGLIGLLVETPKVYGRELPEALFEDLRIVQRNCDHLSGLINDVLDLSQAEAGRLALRREQVKLAEIVDEALAVVRTLLEKKHLSIQTSIPDNLPLVYCDRTRIRQVILNLLSNAARFTENGGITIRAEHQAGSVVVSVADTGPGIPPGAVDRIFEPFAQATEGIWRERSGSGLGLSISKQFIELHEGRMWLESQLGVGTTFFFDLPISSPPVPSAPSPQRWISEEWSWRERTTQSDLPKISPKPRVVVYDETGELYTQLVRRTDEIEFVDIRDLTDVTEELQRCPAHAVLLNGGSTGTLLPLVEKCRASIKDTPIMACCVPSEMKWAAAAGATDFLIRPVTQLDLQHAIQNLGKPVERILIVDDEPDIRQLMTRMLSADPSLEITTASNGAQALEELRTSPPDLMLLDIVMPDMNGWEVLKRKRDDPVIKDIPVIVVSSLDRLEQPLKSTILLATMGEGFSMSKLLTGSLELSALLLKPD